MATNPQYTAYHTQRFSFIGSPQQRDGTPTKDQRFLNMYPELIKSPISEGKKYYLKKRPGVSTFMNLPHGVSQGLYFWSITGQYYAVIGGAVYANGSFLFNISQATGPVGFTEFRTDAVALLFICDGAHAWTITSSDVVQPITDPNFPNPHVPTPIFLDGYIFLSSTNTQTIHNSTLQDPTTWPTDGFIDAEMYPDNIVALAKQQNYLVAIGNQSIEFFYDNANATGSPLQRNAPAVSQFGCPAPQTINQTEKELILVATTDSGGRTIWLIDGFQPTEIANEPVREALDLEGGNIISASAFSIQSCGHKWYVLNLVGNNRTFVYDFEEQMWHEWTTNTGSQSVFSYRFAVDSGNGTPTLVGYTGDGLVSLSPDNTTDLGIAIQCMVLTSKIDFDTIKRKRLYRLSLITDAPNGNNNVPMNVSWSDDDYNTFTTPVVLNINGSYPTITQLGYTRRRAFKFSYEQPFPLRMEAFEVDTIQETRR